MPLVPMCEVPLYTNIQKWEKWERDVTLVSISLFHFQDLSSFVAKSVREVEHVMSVGAENRKVG